VPVVERDFYKEIKKYLNSATLRNRVGKEGKLEARQYDSRKIAKRMEKLYSEICSMPKAKNKIAVVTAIAGGYDNLHEPEYYDENVDYIAFCDTVPKSHIWQVRYIDYTHFTQPRMAAKLYKILAHKFLPDYDWIIWIDGSVVITGSVSELTGTVDGDIGVFGHPLRDCVYEEYEASLKNIHHAKGEPASVRLRQKERYRAEGLPARGGLYACTVMVRKNTKKVSRFFEFWWSEISVASSSDQMPFVYSLWKNPDIKVTKLEGSYHESRWHRYIDHDYKLTPEIKNNMVVPVVQKEIGNSDIVYVTYVGKGTYNYSKVGTFNPNETKPVKGCYAKHLLEDRPDIFIVCKDNSK